MWEGKKNMKEMEGNEADRLIHFPPLSCSVSPLLICPFILLPRATSLVIVGG